MSRIQGEIAPPALTSKASRAGHLAETVVLSYGEVKAEVSTKKSAKPKGEAARSLPSAG